VFEKLVIELRERPVTHFKSWLHTLVRNHCLMWLRSRQSKNGREATAYSLDTFERDAEVNGTEDGSVVELAGGWHLTEDQTLEQDLTLMEKGMQELKGGLPTCAIVFDRDSALPSRRSMR